MIERIRRFWPRAAAAVVVAAVVIGVIALAAPGTQQIFQNVGANLGGAAPAERKDTTGADVPAPADAVGEDGSIQLAGALDLTDRKIVKTGDLTLRVPDVNAAVGLVRALATELGGYVGATSAGASDESATLTMRFPADRFDEALERLRAFDGEVIAEGTREEDVTSSIVDLQARIDNLEVSEAQYRTLIERAEKVNDILSIQVRLDDVRGQIEQLKAQLQQLGNLADLSTLSVTLLPPDEPVERTAAAWDAGATLDNALAALVTVGQAIGTVAIWFGVVGLPILVVLVLLGLIGIRVLPRSMRRSGSEPAP